MSLSGASESVASFARLCTASAREERRILRPASCSTSSKKWILLHLEIRNAKSAVWRGLESRRSIAGEADSVTFGDPKCQVSCLERLGEPSKHCRRSKEKFLDAYLPVCGVAIEFHSEEPSGSLIKVDDVAF
ncbi:hypothetical protein Y032_0442g1543 [Ancylostoma ceylanicum]|uniref:Uncharacterized protein n=1 Tax=Ancylostoma ceylanicum TaxID=53326 RepID=A0A016WYY2_9BILA|nr:hypothetical protein Y032_0442g1543 [Ancylostoma ceylanicum]